MVFQDVQEVINKLKWLSKVPDWVISARRYHKNMKALVLGEGYKELILKIEHIESSKKAEARKKYSRPIKDINAKLLEPVSNVYSANGGNKVYNIDSEEQKSQFLKKLGNVRGGLSLESWLETYWSKELYNVDPSGVMLLEWKDDKAWPTYKSIDCIRYYEANGLSIEYIVFEPIDLGDDKHLWRVIDDEKDYSIIQQGEVFVIDEEKTFSHTFGVCPGRINSDKQHLGIDYRIAPIDVVKETEEELLRDRSILTIYKFLNGFATPYRPKIICPACRGTKKTGTDTCTSCDGKGFMLDKDVTDEIIIPIDTQADNPIPLPANFAGFISPDLEIWNQYKDEAKRLFNEAFEAMWGTRESDEVKDQTAMGVILNTQPMMARLNAWSNVAQSQEQAFTEMLANFYLLGKNKEQRISVITYGRNYIVQPPEFLLSEYQKSNEKGDPITIRDRKLTEYITSKYKNDPQTLRIELVKKSLEPYVHYDINTVKDVYGIQEAQKKGLYTDWWESLTQKDLMKTEQQLEIQRDEWMSERTINTNINNEL
jgi:hypothetical protein